jgi:simple sugar transport system ATP-binding protein
MIVSTRDLTRTFGSFKAVDSISLEFEPGRIHAIVGENGAGKSTFLKLLFGLLSPSGGSVLVDGQEVDFRSSLDAIRAGLGMVQQHFTLVDTLSAIDNIMLGAETVNGAGVLKRTKAVARLEALLPSASLRVPWDVPVSELTVGQRQRVEILKLLFRESRVLFLDEPTAVLAPQEIAELFEVLRALRNQGRTIVLITHKMNEVLDFCDTYAVFRHGRLVKQGVVAEATSSSIVEAMIGRPLPQRTLARQKPKDEVVLSAARLKEPASSARGRLQDISLSVRAGEIVGVAGVEGSGQSALVEAVMGLRRVDGDLNVLGSPVTSVAQVRALGVGLVPEDRHHQALWMDESCRLNYVVGLEDEFIRGGLIDFEAVRAKSSAWSQEFDVRSSSLEAPVSALSGGNQQKLIFAREVAGRKPRLLICHQPTRGVDLAAIDLIYSRLEVLRNEGLGILVVSSELDELMDVCDRLYVFFDGRVTAEYTRDQFDRMKIGSAMTGEVTNA